MSASDETLPSTDPAALPPISSEPATLPPRQEGGEPPDIDAHRLDADAVRVLMRLRNHGHEAYLVGGCVRDLLIGREPKDFDIATSATPDQVRGLFRNSRLIGRRFRLAHVYFKGGKILEVSTFRANPAIVEEPQPSEAAETDVLSEGAEHIAQADQEALEAVEEERAVPSEPVADVEDEVEAAHTAPPEAPPPAVGERDLLITEDNTFGTSVEDALRRDFTMNGLFYDPLAGRVIDHVHGLRDLAAQEIRTIGDPEQRMREDPVRILRAVRFAAKLGLEFEARTYAAMEGAVEDLPRCSAPRLLEETFRLIRSGHAATSLKLLGALDALRVLLKPVDDFLRRQDAEGVQDYYGFVDAMDEQVRAGRPFDDSMLLACILLPLALDEAEPDAPAGAAATGPDAPSADAAAAAVDPSAAPAAPANGNGAQGADDARPSLAKAIESLLQELVQKARLPRRIAERCRMLIMAQRTLSGQRRRRGGLMGFRGHPLFKESLEVFQVWVRATGEHQEALERWRSGQAPAPTAGAEGPRRRRRRRRGGEGRGASSSSPA